MVNLRQCDICKTSLPPTAHWHFVTEGRDQPSDWMLHKHWCPSCMRLVQDFISTLIG